MSQLWGWNDPDDLARQYTSAVRACSHGCLQYKIVARVDVDGFPIKQDGFIYTYEDYLLHWESGSGFHQPDVVDYLQLVHEFDILTRIAADEIDEVWLLGFPYTGYYESIMGGPGAFWCNAPPLGETEAAGRRFVIMGFNYERGVGEMLEDLGHRAESIMAHVYRDRRGAPNLWERFLRYDKTHPGRAECGNVHFAPNSEHDYDWGNRRKVLSRCDDWLNYPDFEGLIRKVNAADWGNGDIRAHHMWWFERFPHVSGEIDGIANNWWNYVGDPNNVV